MRPNISVSAGASESRFPAEPSRLVLIHQGGAPSIHEVRMPLSRDNPELLRRQLESYLQRVYVDEKGQPVEIPEERRTDAVWAFWAGARAFERALLDGRVPTSVVLPLMIEEGEHARAALVGKMDAEGSPELHNPTA